MQPTLPASTQALARYLLEAMGLGLLATAAVSGAACGGKVVVDVGAGSGGNGGGGGASSTGTGTAPFTCDLPAPTYGQTTVCIPGSPGQGCAAVGASGLADALLAELVQESCGQAGGQLASVLCGPDPTQQAACCYVVDGISYLCGGRPFVVDGAPRVAAATARGDWLGPAFPRDAGAGPGPGAPAGETRAALAEAWTRSALDEHASVASFARFVLELLAVGAPADLVYAAQRAMGDEIEHARLCFGLATAYAGHPVGPGALAPGDAGARGDLAAIAAAAVREGCVGETLAAFEAAAARADATDPAVRAALDVIARDEAEHAALAFRFVAWVMEGGDAAARAAVGEAFAAALGAPPALRPDHAGDAGALRAHGQLPTRERLALAARCLDEVVAPCAAALRRAAQPVAAPATAMI
jgi:hypothetical protein